MRQSKLLRDDVRFELDSFSLSPLGLPENGVRNGRNGSEGHHQNRLGVCSFRTGVTTQDNVNFHEVRVWISVQ